jgi:hypothetical protein
MCSFSLFFSGLREGDVSLPYSRECFLYYAPAKLSLALWDRLDTSEMAAYLYKLY